MRLGMLARANYMFTGWEPHRKRRSGGEQVRMTLLPNAGHAGEDSEVWVAHGLADAHD